MGKNAARFGKWGAAPMVAVLALALVGPAGAAGEQASIQVAQADCYAVGQRVAAENGGTLAKAQSASRGGQNVCVIVVLVPGKDGERPRRTEIVVPAN